MPVSVIIPALNAARFIDAALMSLVAEREAVDLDIIVIDDGSTDETRALVERRAAEFSEIRLLANPRKGIAAARNTGLDNLPGDVRYVAFLDADDVSYPGRLARQQARMDNEPDTAVIYGRVEMFSAFDEAALAPAKGSRTKIIRGPYLQSAMYRPHVFDIVGRFDESFKQGCDTDYVLRVVEKGVNLVLDDGIAAFYRRHDANVTLDTAQMQREFMLASLKWAARNKLTKGGELPAVFSELFLRRDDIEKDF
jgi:glycosyltransferase involved in cell wall biosynthesis